MAADQWEIAATLRQEIATGQYPPGSLLPPAAEMAGRFGVSESTLALVYRLLRSEGLVRTHQGRGTVVNPVPAIRRDAVRRQRREIRETGENRGAFDAELREAGLEPRTETEVGRALPPENVAARFGVPAETEAVFRRRRMYAGTEPVQLATSWIPADIAVGTPIEQADTGPGGLYSRLADAGRAPVRFAEEISVRVPDGGEAAALGIEPDHRIYVITRTAYDGQGGVVEVCMHVMPTHQWTLAYTWLAEE
jgi:GntR family transcriptional regulator